MESKYGDDVRDVIVMKGPGRGSMGGSGMGTGTGVNTGTGVGGVSGSGAGTGTGYGSGISGGNGNGNGSGMGNFSGRQLDVFDTNTNTVNNRTDLSEIPRNTPKSIKKLDIKMYTDNFDKSKNEKNDDMSPSMTRSGLPIGKLNTEIHGKSTEKHNEIFMKNKDESPSSVGSGISILNSDVIDIKPISSFIMTDFSSSDDDDNNENNHGNKNNRKKFGNNESEEEKLKRKMKKVHSTSSHNISTSNFSESGTIKRDNNSFSTNDNNSVTSLSGTKNAVKQSASLGYSKSYSNSADVEQKKEILLIDKISPTHQFNSNYFIFKDHKTDKLDAKLDKIVDKNDKNENRVFPASPSNAAGERTAANFVRTFGSDQKQNKPEENNDNNLKKNQNDVVVEEISVVRASVSTAQVLPEVVPIVPEGEEKKLTIR